LIKEYSIDFNKEIIFCHIHGKPPLKRTYLYFEDNGDKISTMIEMFKTTIREYEVLK
jgi:hypothetical protein